MRSITVALGVCSALTGMGAAQGADGKAIYAKACAVCHNALPPKLGDKAAWDPRLKQGVDAMVAGVIKGKGTMPPRGGSKALTDEELRAAVEYIAGQVK